LCFSVFANVIAHTVRLKLFGAETQQLTLKVTKSNLQTLKHSN